MEVALRDRIAIVLVLGVAVFWRVPAIAWLLVAAVVGNYIYWVGLRRS